MLYDEGLYLVWPGQVRTLWNVLAPTRQLPPEAVEGEYDTVSKHDFADAKKTPNLLIGGMNDVVVLELVAPLIDPIGPSTRLILRRKRMNYPPHYRAAPEKTCSASISALANRVRRVQGTGNLTS